MNPPGDPTTPGIGVGTTNQPEAFTFRQGMQLARLRARRLSMWSRIIPHGGDIFWPWVFPLFLVGVGAKGQRIHHIPGASLSLTGGSGGAVPVPSIRRLGLVLFVTQLLLTVVGVLLVELATTMPRLITACAVVLIVFGPLGIESLGMFGNLLVRPGQLTLGRRRKELARAGCTVMILAWFVRDPRAPKGTGRILIEQLQPHWRREHAVIIGYPANPALTKSYRTLGAVSDGPGQRMKFDYRTAEMPTRSSQAKCKPNRARACGDRDTDKKTDPQTL